jgi:uncharacterized protein with NRDE domain
MCLILASTLQEHPEYILIIAANREEAYARPTAPLGLWADAPILAGRDLLANGTWLGLNIENGRWAGLTSVHEPGKTDKRPAGVGRSRGEVPSAWLQSKLAPQDFLKAQLALNDEYEGYNLLFGTLGAEPGLHFLSNRSGEVPPATNFAPALYALSNASLDTPWPKSAYGKQHIQSEILPLLEESEDAVVNALFKMLRDGTDHSLAHPNGIDTVGSKAIFWQIPPAYGTRASTVILARKDGSVRYLEKTFDFEGKETGKVEKEVRIGEIFA